MKDKHMRISAPSLLVLGFLAACGGSDEQTSFAVLDATYKDIDTRARAENPLTTETMPTTGTASYAGAVEYFEADGSVGMVSAVNLQADFAKNTIGGSLSDFVLSTNDRLDGSLPLSNGTISGSDYVADVGGTLRAKSTGFDMSGTVSGSFYRDDASLVDVNVDLAESGGATQSGVGAAEQ